MRLLKAIRDNKKLSFFDIESGKTKTFSQFTPNHFVNQQAKDIIFLYLDNGIDSIEVFFTSFATHHVTTLLSKELSIHLKQNLENLYKPAFIYDTTRENIDDYYEQDRLFTRNEFISKTIDPQIKIMISTSGTTGSPKFVKLSEENIYNNALSILDYLPVIDTDVTPLNLPIYYSYGLSVLITNAIRGGQIICGVKNIFNKLFWVDFQKYGFTSLAGVPYVYEVLNNIGFTKIKYPTLRYLTQAGGKLNDQLIKIFQQYSICNHIDFFMMYGQTEATARISYLNITRHINKIGSVGKAVLNGKLMIDKTTNELIYHGPNVYGGYAESISDLMSYQKDCSLYTGDIAKFDNEGFLYIIGRINRFVKILGSRISLDEIENILKDNFSGGNFVCIGKEDTYLQLYSTDADLEQQNVIKFMEEFFKIDPYFIKYKYINNLPLTMNGKINYKKLD